MKGLLKLEIEKLQPNFVDADNISESGSLKNEYVNIENRHGKHLSGCTDEPKTINHGNLAAVNGKEVNQSIPNGGGTFTSCNPSDVSSF